MTTPNQTTLLRRILDHPRVKAYGEGRGWHAQDLRCSGCHEAPYKCKCTSGTAPPYERHGDYFYTGPDLASESNLHELLGLADAIACMGVDVDYDPTDNRYFVLMHGPDYQTIGDGHGPTRTLAVIAALGRALNIGDTE